MVLSLIHICKKYLPTHTGGKSIFVIPVELNKNNSIIGMTTKMSTAHEITYSILVYLSAADEAGDGSVSADGSSSGRNFGSNEKLEMCIRDSSSAEQTCI